MDNRALLKMMKSIEERVHRKIEPYASQPMGRLRESIMGYQPTFHFDDEVEITSGVYEGKRATICGEAIGGQYQVWVELNGKKQGKCQFIPKEHLRLVSEPPQGGSVLAPLDGRITMRSGVADALAHAFGGSASTPEPYTPQPEYDTDALFADAEWGKL